MFNHVFVSFTTNKEIIFYIENSGTHLLAMSLSCSLSLSGRTLTSSVSSTALPVDGSSQLLPRMSIQNLKVFHMMGNPNQYFGTITHHLSLSQMNVGLNKLPKQFTDICSNTLLNLKLSQFVVVICNHFDGPKSAIRFSEAQVENVGSSQASCEFHFSGSSQLGALATECVYFLPQCEMTSQNKNSKKQTIICIFWKQASHLYSLFT